MLQSMAGPGESWQLGDERDVEDYIADEWCKPEVGIAEPVADPVAAPSVEVTPASPAAKTVVPTKGGKAR